MSKTPVRLACLLLIGAASAAFAGPQMPLYKNPDAPVSRRVADLLSRMTLEEKVAQMEAQATIPDLSGSGAPTAMGLIRHGQVDETKARETLGQGIGAFFLISFGPMTATDGVAQQDAIQTWVLKNTRLGIPVLFQAEALHGAVVDGGTSFPQAIALGSTWDPALVRQVFGVVGKESRAAGMAQVLAPVFDLSRDPRYGRVEEMYSEDPHLVGEMGLAAVQGLQGTGPRIDQDHVIATAKHFIHGQPENGTNVGPNDFSERTMRSVFMRPFEKAVKVGHVGAVMPSYNENDGGIPSHANSWLLRDVLRGEWGFTGITVSDWSAVPELHSKQFVADSIGDAGARAVNAGVDMELPTPVGYLALVNAVRAGKVSRKNVDAAVSRILTTKFNAGLFEHPFSDPARAVAELGTKAHATLARKAADEAIVLLKNDNNLLPLDPTRSQKIAIIGPNADKVRLGTYSGAPPYYVTVLDGIRKRLGDKAQISFAEGVRISEPDKSPQLNKLTPYKAPDATNDAKLIAQAVETARGADVVILALGGNETVSREAFAGIVGHEASLGDTDDLELPGRQNELVRAIAALGKPTVAVLLNGRPYAISSLSKTVPAIVEGWYLGQETGNAVAGVLFGDVNPSGRLPVTIARNVGQLPVFYYRKPPARLGYVGSDNSPLYPFGFGLSYTSFTYGKLTMDQDRMKAGGTARVSVTITNTGSRAGDEVAQLYVRPHYSSTVQPVMRLIDFRRVHLQAGQSASVTFAVGREQLATLGANMKWAVEPGTFDLLAGPNSAQLQTEALAVSP